jgi:hypothetical protein
VTGGPPHVPAAANSLLASERAVDSAALLPCALHRHGSRAGPASLRAGNRGAAQSRHRPFGKRKSEKRKSEKRKKALSERTRRLPYCRSVLGRAGDHPARHLGLLIKVIARANPVVASPGLQRYSFTASPSLSRGPPPSAPPRSNRGPRPDDIKMINSMRYASLRWSGHTPL